MILAGSPPPSRSVPGDKSITHRALLLSALADGVCRISGALTSLDALSTMQALRDLGVKVQRPAPDGLITVRPSGRLIAPAGPLDCGNSGTTARLLLGILAGTDMSATLTGDDSLRRRPMRRVTEPLALMGARFTPAEADRLPITVEGAGLRPIDWELPVSSAQLKSAILLAGVTGRVPVAVREPAGRSRDHTERMLRSFGYRVDGGDDGWIRFEPSGTITPFDFAVPGDISSAAFLLGAALLAEGGELRIEGVGVNPTRSACLDVIARMGGTVMREREAVRHGEPVADLVVGPADLHATEVLPAEIPGLIDEVPILAVLASRASGTTVFHEVGELRVKESDRLALLAANLQALGVEAEAGDNTLWVTGTDRTPVGRIVTEGDHRIAMAFMVLGTLPAARVEVDDPDCAAVSFPGFREALAGLAAPGAVR